MDQDHDTDCESGEGVVHMQLLEETDGPGSSPKTFARSNSHGSIVVKAWRRRHKFPFARCTVVIVLCIMLGMIMMCRIHGGAHAPPVSATVGHSRHGGGGNQIIPPSEPSPVRNRTSGTLFESTAFKQAVKKLVRQEVKELSCTSPITTHRRECGKEGHHGTFCKPYKLMLMDKERSSTVCYLEMAFTNDSAHAHIPFIRCRSASSRTSEGELSTCYVY